MGAVRTLIAWAGDDPRREGVIDTPERVVDAYGEWFEGYEADPAQELSRTFEDVQGCDGASQAGQMAASDQALRTSPKTDLRAARRRSPAS
jgi:hypothetical protein